MSLDKTNFEYQSYYVGWWYRPEFPDEKLSGTLFIEDQKIWIELIFNPLNDGFPEHIKMLDGHTCAIDSSGKEHAANIVAEDLNFIRYCRLENGLWHYKFSVSGMYIYEGNFDKDKISSICIRASIFDKWAEHIMRQAYKPISYQDIPCGHHVIHHVLPNQYTLLKSSQYSVYLNFTSIYQFMGINQGIEQKSFCKILFHNTLNFQEALDVVNQIQYLFYLLTNRIYRIEYLYSESGSNTFFYKPNEKSINRYIEKHSNLEPFTSLGDFTDIEIQNIFQKWIDIYSEFSSGINSYFDTITNIYTPPSSKIKNFISTIDMLSKDMKGPNGNISQNTKRAKFIDRIISQYNISQADANELKTRFLTQKGNELKLRLSEFVTKIDKFKIDDWDTDFVVKIVNTRHNLTHPRANEQPCFNKNDYIRVAHHLQMIIQSFLLDSIGVKENIINKILARPGLTSTIS